MKLRQSEVEFLSVWAREEKAPDPYVLPLHQLQAEHKVPGVVLIRIIKAWARAENRKDEDIFNYCTKANPPWPWSESELQLREQEIQAEQAACGF